MKIRGVNLGNWLVLEKWMSQELFLGLEAEDESAFHPEQTVGSEAVPFDLLKDFYIKGYEAVRKYCLPDTKVVIHDQFILEQWEDFMPPEQ